MNAAQAAAAAPALPPPSTRRLFELAWPILVAQLAVVGLGVIDTVMAGRLSATDLAGVAVGSAIYSTVFVGAMAVLGSLTQIAGHHFGARRYAEIGTDVGQTLWLAMFLTLLAAPPLIFNGPWMRLLGAEANVAAISTAYLWAVTCGMPASLASRAFVGLNAAVGRPRVTMAINVAAFALKVPLNLLLMYGAGPIPALGGVGCGVATALLLWLIFCANFLLWRLDPFYARFRPPGHRRHGPIWERQKELLRLGVPAGMSVLIEVSSFTFMALLLARFGAVTVAGHQIVANLVALLFMVPLAYGIATSVLVSQSLGAGSPRLAREAALRGYRIAVTTGLVLAAATWIGREAIVATFTTNAEVAAVSLALIGLATLFHLFDAAQGVAGFILRGYKIAVLPMVIYSVCLWAIGLAGGWWLAYRPPSSWSYGPAASFWIAGTLGLVAAAIALTYMVIHAARQRQQQGKAAE
jgi:multidrug resistance protein, MATE family